MGTAYIYISPPGWAMFQGGLRKGLWKEFMKRLNERGKPVARSTYKHADLQTYTKTRRRIDLFSKLKSRLTEV